MRRVAVWFGLASVAVLTVASAATAQTASQLDIRLERDTRPRTSAIELGVYYTVTVTDRATGQPPTNTYDVFGLATNQRGEQTPFFTCPHTSDTDSRVSRGVYDCPVFVDHGGRWDFVAVVNERRTNTKQAPVTVARASVPFELTTNQVYNGNPEKEAIKGKFIEVTALGGHALVGGVWFCCVMALAALVFPVFRRSLSPVAIYQLERRLELIVKLTWAATGVVVASGTYLLLKQTAYKTPFSRSAVTGVFALPFGKPYFLTLAVKLAIYAAMIVASIPLVLAAHRSLGLPAGRSQSNPRPPAQGSGGGIAVATRTEAPPAGEPAASMPVRVAGLTVLSGSPAILLCVTLLKYFHELVEASRVLPGN